MEEIDHKAARLELEKMLADLGATISIEHIESRPDGSEFKDAAHYAYAITIGRATLRGFYSNGWGNYAEHAKKLPWHIARESAFVAKVLAGQARPTIAAEMAVKEAKPYLARKHKPALVDVMWSLLMDAAGSDEPFAEWAANYGYSDDSIKAKAIWEKCNDTRRDLASAIPSDKLARAYDLAAFM